MNPGTNHKIINQGVKKELVEFAQIKNFLPLFTLFLEIKEDMYIVENLTTSFPENPNHEKTSFVHSLYGAQL